MSSFKVFNRQVGPLVALAGLLVSVITPVVVPVLASAAIIQERSITMSSSATGRTNTTYEVEFTAATGGGGVVIDFCSNSPLIGSSCTAPTGFSATGAASADATATAGTASKITMNKTFSAGVVSIAITGITNPTSTGTFYARIVTYDTHANAQAYESEDLKTGAVDQGSVALSATPTIGVQAAVLETMTFCVSSTSPGDNCTTNVNPPTIEIGETIGTVRALSTQAVSTGDIFTQLSTNASRGAVINLKSEVAGCGGMRLVGGVNGNCHITPADADFSANTPKFGVKVSAGTDGSSPNGTIQATNGYNASTYLLNFNGTDESTGVTSTYGDPIIDTNGGPVNNKAMKLTFGASINSQTPAGRYSADLSLIATGTF